MNVRRLFILLNAFIFLCSCNVEKDQNLSRSYENQRFSAEGSRNRNGNDVIVDRVMSGEDPARVLNQVMSGPAESYCSECLDDSFPEASRPGERPLRGATLLKYLKKNYPKGCGYTFRGWSNQDSRNFKPNIHAVANGRIPNCHESNCSTATYLALIEAIRGTPHEKRLKGKINFGGPLYKSFVTEPNMIERTFGPGPFNLGSFQKVQRTDEKTIANYQSKGWPSAGDFVVVNRKNGSGHSVVFSHYQGSGSNRQMCFWSSNKGTNGMGVQCERTGSFASFHIGRIE